MGAITEGAFLGVLAGAEVDRAGGFGLVWNGHESGTLVGAIAERLVLAVSARAPVVGLAGFDEDGDRGLLGDVGSGHDEKMTEDRWKIKDG
jgi:hypothetical protein